jgi:hypothetical protein
MPAKNRAHTLQEKFGFLDGDLRTPVHDAIMVWLDGEAERLARTFASKMSQCSEEYIAKLRATANQMVTQDFSESAKDWPGLGAPPVPKFLGVRKKTWESPIVTPSKFTVGFVDMEVIVEYEVLDYSWSNQPRELPSWKLWRQSATILFEVKSSIPSVGEVIRQIRLYQEYKDGIYVVVSPDTRFASILRGQGIHFIEVPALPSALETAS